MAESTVIFNDKQWRKFLSKTKNKLSRPYKLLKAVASIYAFKDIIDHFDKQSGPRGKWEKRSKLTNIAYDKMGGKYRSSNRLLQLTGHLRQTLIKPNTKQVGKSGILLFSGAPYSGVHDRGERVPARTIRAKGGGFLRWWDASGNPLFAKESHPKGFKMPKRKFMWLSNRARELMAKAILSMAIGEK